MDTSHNLPVWCIFKKRKLLARLDDSTVILPQGYPGGPHPHGPAGGTHHRTSRDRGNTHGSGGEPHRHAFPGAGTEPPQRHQSLEHHLLIDAGERGKRSGCYGGIAPADYEPPPGFEFIELRSLLPMLDEMLFQRIAKAKQRTEWDFIMQRCPTCTTSLHNVEGEYAKQCPQCNIHFYPPISPAIIVAILKDDRLLLAHNGRFPPGRYSLIAGFVEPGENLETCVHREIEEEVGILVQNITYFGSQPWPFPHSLMIGFTADYAGGTLTVDNHEILDADWFSRGSMPELPPRGSISRTIIDWFIEGDTT